MYVILLGVLLRVTRFLTPSDLEAVRSVVPRQLAGVIELRPMRYVFRSPA